MLFRIATLFVISLFVKYFIQRNQLLSSALSVNEEYAHKIATSSDLHFHGIQLEPKYSASVLATSPNNDQITDQELTRILKQSQYLIVLPMLKQMVNWQALPRLHSLSKRDKLWTPLSHAYL